MSKTVNYFLGDTQAIHESMFKNPKSKELLKHAKLSNWGSILVIVRAPEWAALLKD